MIVSQAVSIDSGPAGGLEQTTSKRPAAARRAAAAIFAVIAETRDLARRACQLARVEYDELPFALDPIAARDAGMGYVTKPLKLARGDMAEMGRAPRRLSGRRPRGRPPPRPLPRTRS